MRGNREVYSLVSEHLGAIMMLKKETIRDNFSRSGEKYESLALMQQDLADQLFDRLTAYNLSFNNILDLCCGSGYLTRRLAEHYPQAKVFGVDLAPGMIAAAKKKPLPNLQFLEGDVEQELSFAASSFELIVSNASLHWTDLNKVLPQVKKLLVPGGRFIFNTFGPGTLKELKEAGFKVNKFPSLVEWEKLAKAYFREVKLFSYQLARFFPAVKALIKHLKETGVSATSETRGRGDRSFSFKKYREKFSRADGSVTATYEVLSGELS